MPLCSLAGAPRLLLPHCSALDFVDAMPWEGRGLGCIKMAIITRKYGRMMINQWMEWGSPFSNLFLTCQVRVSRF